MTEPFRTVRVAGIRQDCPTTKVFTFEDPNGQPFVFSAGQYCELQVDGYEPRPFSFASSPLHPERVEFAVKSVGPITHELHELKVGDVLRMSPVQPARLTFDQSDRSALGLSAGGSGITPLMSILRLLEETDALRDITVLYSNRDADNIIYLAELERLRTVMPNLKVVHTLTGDPPADWTGERGRLSAEIIRRQVPDFLQRSWYVCGPQAFLDAVSKILRTLGLEEKRLHLGDG